MSSLSRTLRLALALVAAVGLSASCTATEQVTIDASAFARATAAVPSPTPAPVPTEVEVSEPVATPEPLPDPEPTAEPEQADDDPAEEPEPTAEPTVEVTETSAGLPGTSCTFAGLGTFDDMQFGIAFQSATNTADDATVRFNVNNPDGSLLTDGTLFVRQLQPGEEFRLIAETFEEVPAGADGSDFTCEVTEIEAFGVTTDGFAPTASDSCQFSTLDAFDDIQVELVVTSPLDEDGDLTVIYALRGPNGARFGDGLEFVTDIGAGETVTVEADSLAEYPSWVAPSQFSCDILIIESFG